MNDTEWPTERIIEQYRAEVHAAFEAENAAWRAQEVHDLEQIKREHPEDYADLVDMDGGVRDSFMWEVYSNSTMRFNRNGVSVVLPNGFAIYPDFIGIFDDASVVWTTASVGAETVDGEAHVVIRLLLVDYWDDDHAAEWERQHRAKTEGEQPQ